MPSEHRLLDFARRTLSLHNALVEPVPQGLEAVLPEDLVRQLGTEEDLLLTLPSALEGHPLACGSTLLGNLLDLAQGEGALAHLEVTEIPHRTGGLVHALQQSVQLVNVVGEVGRIRPGTGGYLIVNYRYQARSQEDETSGILPVTCNEETLATAPWLLEQIQPKSRLVFKESTSGGWRSPFPRLVERWNQLARQLLDEELEPFFQAVSRRISRSRRQIERVHRRERKDLLGDWPPPSSAAQDDLLDELHQLEQRYLHEIEEIVTSHRLHLNVEPIAALRISMPVTRVEYPIRRRKAERVLTWIWNPLLEEFEPLPCEACGRSTFRINGCDGLHCLCSVCYQRGCPLCGS